MDNQVSNKLLYYYDYNYYNIRQHKSHKSQQVVISKSIYTIQREVLTFFAFLVQSILVNSNSRQFKFLVNSNFFNRISGPEFGFVVESQLVNSNFSLIQIFRLDFAGPTDFELTRIDCIMRFLRGLLLILLYTVYHSVQKQIL
eukprot:EC097228.1.p1 GENE.EC097228.1~~EC097228.1.p1  ORF type:complete len:143 (+),score=0.13 EC097228.1:175-603(+)